MNVDRSTMDSEVPDFTSSLRSLSPFSHRDWNPVRSFTAASSDERRAIPVVSAISTTRSFGAMTLSPVAHRRSRTPEILSCSSAQSSRNETASADIFNDLVELERARAKLVVLPRLDIAASDVHSTLPPSRPPYAIRHPHPNPDPDPTPNPPRFTPANPTTPYQIPPSLTETLRHEFQPWRKAVSNPSRLPMIASTEQCLVKSPSLLVELREEQPPPPPSPNICRRAVIPPIAPPSTVPELDHVSPLATSHVPVTAAVLAPAAVPAQLPVQIDVAEPVLVSESDSEAGPTTMPMLSDSHDSASLGGSPVASDQEDPEETVTDHVPAPQSLQSTTPPQQKPHRTKEHLPASTKPKIRSIVLPAPVQEEESNDIPSVIEPLPVMPGTFMAVPQKMRVKSKARLKPVPDAPVMDADPPPLSPLLPTPKEEKKISHPGPEEQDSIKLAPLAYKRSLRPMPNKKGLMDLDKMRQQHLRHSHLHDEQDSLDMDANGVGSDPSKENGVVSSLDIMARYSYIDQSTLPAMRTLFERLDVDRDGFISPLELVHGLRISTSAALTSKQIIFLMHLLEFVPANHKHGIFKLVIAKGLLSRTDEGLTLRLNVSRISFHHFTLIVTLANRVCHSDARSLLAIDSLNPSKLPEKLLVAKGIFKLHTYDDANSQGISFEDLHLEMRSSGMFSEFEQEQVLRTLSEQHLEQVDFITFLSLIPLFLDIHSNIVSHPL